MPLQLEIGYIKAPSVLSCVYCSREQVQGDSIAFQKVPTTLENVKNEYSIVCMPCLSGLFHSVEKFKIPVRIITLDEEVRAVNYGSYGVKNE